MRLSSRTLGGYANSFYPMFSGVPKWFLQNYGPTEASRCALFRYNMIRYAAAFTSQPIADLPPNFDAQLNSIGYRR